MAAINRPNYDCQSRMVSTQEIRKSGTHLITYKKGKHTRPLPHVDISKSLSSYLQNFLRRLLFRNPSCSNFVPSARAARELFTEFPKSEPRLWPRHSFHFSPLQRNQKQWMTWARSMVRGTNETSSIFRLLFLPSSFPDHRARNGNCVSRSPFSLS